MKTFQTVIYLSMIAAFAGSRAAAQTSAPVPVVTRTILEPQDTKAAENDLRFRSLAFIRATRVGVALNPTRAIATDNDRSSRTHRRQHAVIGGLIAAGVGGAIGAAIGHHMDQHSDVSTYFPAEAVLAGEGLALGLLLGVVVGAAIP